MRLKTKTTTASTHIAHKIDIFERHHFAADFRLFSFSTFKNPNCVIVIVLLNSFFFVCFRHCLHYFFYNQMLINKLLLYFKIGRESKNIGSLRWNGLDWNQRVLLPMLYNFSQKSKDEFHWIFCLNHWTLNTKCQNFVSFIFKHV